ncbi:PTS transporter subunit EIIC [Streptobacillus moniliformis]|uniref:Phosphotransferase system EIIC n=1 Tax=Streptobacillus moniliformis (strain ATCC 14647 / DSM 12112 / NCTC 10651 / 9901) TaxID=519441 RepID=D1AYR0_STRM9|nr:PTS transporter subunit EIIC [Streptobacillus moniliformis]ACZ01436.1 phosphotransferase system EIIC [Streptobacillus moniliformis DSM 12112]AVL43556.1 PTS trehalose transporter subunit IIBC [Streptobacillus moniliformis]SQA13402.1 PTS system EIIBC component SA0186 [Streptobacillus moniliformis]
MNARKISEEIFNALGGKENILSNSVCMTRLRVGIKESVDVEAIKKIEGVLGVVEAETIQIVLGPGKVNLIGEEFTKLTGISLGSFGAKDVADENKKINKSKHNGKIQQFLQKIANVFVPLLPGIISAGLILGLTNVINITTKGAFVGQWWFAAIKTIGFGMFTYLAIYVGMNTAKEFGGTPILGGIIGALFVGNAAHPLLSKVNDMPLNLPIINKSFTPSIGGLLASLFMGIIVAKIERGIRKVMPTILDTFFTPLFTLLISVFIAIFLIQPLGNYVTKEIFVILDVVYNKFGIAGGYILSAGFLPLVSVGLHQALAPIHVLLNSPEGPTQGINYLLPILMMAGGGQVGAGLAIYFKTKNKKLKTLTRDALPVGILGIGEPLMYAVTLPLGKPFITACLGAGFGGLLASLFKIGTITQGVSGLFGLLIVKPGTWHLYLIAMLGAYIGGFVLTYLFGVDEERIESIYGK